VDRPGLTIGSFKIKVRPAARYLQASLKPPGYTKLFRFEDSSRFFRLPQQATAGRADMQPHKNGILCRHLGLY